MSEFSQEKEIDAELLKRKKRFLRKGRSSVILKRLLGITKVLLFFTFIAYLLFFSPFFLISELKTNSLVYIDSEEILSEFEVLKGDNFFLTDVSSLRAEVIKKYPFVERVYTEKIFPNSILINIREKNPVFMASNDQGCFLLDKGGFVLLQGDCNVLKSSYSVKEVFGVDLDNIEFIVNSQSNFYNAKYLCEIVNILDYYGYRVKSIQVENSMAEFELYDNRFFIFSFFDEIDVQLKRLIIIVKKIEVEEILFKSIDLRYQRPVLIEQEMI